MTQKLDNTNSIMKLLSQTEKGPKRDLISHSVSV